MANSLLNNLIAYWGLDEAAGANNALDKHSGARTLTQYNSPGSSTGKVYAGARTFDGAATNNDHFRRTSETALQAGDVDFTVAAWVYLSSTSVGQVIACKLGDLSEYIMYYDNSVSRFKFGVSVDGSDVYEVTASNFGAPSTSTWYLVVGWHDAANNQLGISVNAGTANTTSHTTGSYTGTNPFVVGSGWDGANTFWQLNGRLQSVSLWKSSSGGGGVLTSTQRTQLYNSGNGLAYASFDSGSTAHDLTATGITTGTPTLDAPTLGQVHALTAAAITAGAPVLDAPSMSGSAALTANGITTSAPTLGTPTLGQTHALTASAIATGAPALGTATVGQKHALSASAITTTAPTLGAPKLLPHLAATVGGVLRANVTNGRYLENDAGPLIVAGFHTWADVQDIGTSNPPDAFDWDTFLAALTSYGANLTKLWRLEATRHWPSDDTQYFGIQPWTRTGPGNAADGGLKFDLTSYNAEYFERLRERCIELGNAGVYVVIQLFQGFHVDNTKEGGATGDPWAYNPFNSANNVNSVNGDIDGDGIGDDSRSTSNTACYNVQKSFVEHVVDTVNDLDNVLYEISNEDGTWSATWQAALVDYIHTYEAGKAKQHPVGFTKIYPGGSNSTLTSSNADWISPDEDLTPAAQNSTSQAWMYDTDHAVGITSTRAWAWIALCQGYGGAWYMDLWDSGAGGAADTTADATYMQIRRTLGWLLDYAARVDLANATPQGSLSSTGYALAKTTGQAQILAYQSGSGAFTVDLTSITGTFSVEWQRVANSAGTISSGSNVSGGAVRTLTPPWSGEDVVAFLQLTQNDLTASGITTGAPSVAVATVGQTHALGASAITTGAAVVDAPTLAQAHALAAAGFAAGTPTLDAPTFAQVHALTAVAITTGTPALGAPSMSGESALSADDIAAGAPSVGAATLAQVHILTAVTVVTGTPTVDTAAIGQTHALSAADITTGAPALGTPSMTGEAVLSAADVITSAPVLGAATLGQVHALGAAAIAAGAPDVAAATIGQVHVLTAVLIVAGAVVVGAPNLDRAVIPTPAERTYVVAWEDRTFVVGAEDRTFVID